MAILRTIRSLLFRFRGLIHREQLDQDLSSELESHLHFHIEDNLRAGMSSSEARRKALLKLGGLQQTTENYRDQGSAPVLESIWRDAVFGFRQLVKNPGFTFVAIFTLALGIGANTAIFTVVYGVLLRPLPFPHSERIVALNELEEGQSDQMSVTATELRRLQDFSGSFEYIAGYTEIGLNLSSTSGAEHLRTMPASAAFFSVLSIAPARGRDFFPSEDTGSGEGGGGNKGPGGGGGDG